MMTPLQADWRAAYSRQRWYISQAEKCGGPGAYYVARDPRITEALRRVFVVTRVRQARMRSRPSPGRAAASYPETALIRSATLGSAVDGASEAATRRGWASAQPVFVF
jgi:hypothetical protein